MELVDILFTAPSGQPPVKGPAYYEELRSVKYGHVHRVCCVIGTRFYVVTIVATFSLYYGRVCNVPRRHVDPLESNLRALYPDIALRRMEQFQPELRN